MIPTARDNSIHVLDNLGNYIVEKLATAQPTPKYALEIAIRLPIMFLIHQWCLLAPYSDVTIPDIALLALKIYGAILLLGCTELGKVNLMYVYSAMAVDVFVAWRVDIAYWQFQKVVTDCASESCPNIYEVDGLWMTVGDILLFQSLYVIFLILVYKQSLDFGTVVATYQAIFLLMCMHYRMVTLFYYYYKIVFVVSVIGHLVYYIAHDDRIQMVSRFQQLGLDGLLSPGRWIWRDLNTCFAILYFSTCFVIDLARLGTNTVFTVQYWTSFIGHWTTSFAILLNLGAFFGTCCNCAVAISGSICLGSMNFKEAFDNHVGHVVDFGMIIVSIQAGILSSSQIERTEDMPFVLLLVVFSIIHQLWNLAETRLLFLLNSGDILLRMAVFRVVLFMTVIVTGPTCFVIYIAAHHGFDLWPLMNITGVVLVLTRAAFTLIECVLFSMSWCMDDGVERLSSVIYCNRICKSIFTIIATLLFSYHKLISPYFDGPFIFKVAVAVVECLFITLAITVTEWNTYQQRRQLLAKMDYFVNATPDQLAAYEDDCAVCYDDLKSGKRLACGHIFHTKCLTRWFQIKTTCPLCNTFVETYDHVV